MLRNLLPNMMRYQMKHNNEYKVGDKVTWKSQASGRTKSKTGVVVAVIPSGTNFIAYENDLLNEYKCRSAYGGGSRRNHESYAVLVPNGSGKGVLYWPRVSALSAA